MSKNSPLFLTRSLCSSLLMYGEIFMNPINMKKIPKRIDRDFNTMDVIFANFQTLYFNFSLIEQNQVIPILLFQLNHSFLLPVFLSFFFFWILCRTKKPILKPSFFTTTTNLFKKKNTFNLNANRTKRCKRLCLHLYNPGN